MDEALTLLHTVLTAEILYQDGRAIYALVPDVVKLLFHTRVWAGQREVSLTRTTDIQRYFSENDIQIVPGAITFAFTEKAFLTNTNQFGTASKSASQDIVNEKGTLVIVDGFHRLSAAGRHEGETLAAIVLIHIVKSDEEIRALFKEVPESLYNDFQGREIQMLANALARRFLIEACGAVFVENCRPPRVSEGGLAALLYEALVNSPSLLLSAAIGERSQEQQKAEGIILKMIKKKNEEVGKEMKLLVSTPGEKKLFETATRINFFLTMKKTWIAGLAKEMMQHSDQSAYLPLAACGDH